MRQVLQHEVISGKATILLSSKGLLLQSIHRDLPSSINQNETPLLCQAPSFFVSIDVLDNEHHFK